MRVQLGLLIGTVALAGCQPGAAGGDPDGSRAAATPVPSPSQTASPESPRPPATEPMTSMPDAEPARSGVTSCEAQIGTTAATALARQCRAVSPATRPPCNAANSCALVRDETARGCAFLGTDAAVKAGCLDPEGTQAAVAVIERYYDAVAAHDYPTAYALWGGDGAASGQDQAAFARGFADTRSVRVAPGKPGLIEGAAGSRYVTVPVTVTSTLTDGTRQRFAGQYVLRRVAPIEGASLDQRRWHIDSATLKRG